MIQASLVVRRDERGVAWGVVCCPGAIIVKGRARTAKRAQERAAEILTFRYPMDEVVWTDGALLDRPTLMRLFLEVERITTPPQPELWHRRRRVSLVAARHGWRCYWCGRKASPDVGKSHPLRATVEHLVPLSKGGGSQAENLRVSCLRCNQARGSALMPPPSVWET